MQLLYDSNICVANSDPSQFCLNCFGVKNNKSLKLVQIVSTHCFVYTWRIKLIV